MVSTREKKQQNLRLLSQLSESNAGFMVGQCNHEAQFESRANTVDRNTSLNDTNDPTQVNSPLVVMHTLEKNIFSKVRIEVDSVMTTVETRVQDAVLPAVENLVIPMVKLAIKLVNASSGHGVDSSALDPDQKVFFREYQRPSDERLK